MSQTEIDLPASTAPRNHSVPVPCDVAGGYYITFATDAGSVPSRDMRPAVYEVAELSASAAPAAKRELVQTIDLRALAPDYSSDRTRVATSAAGSYRESSATGFTKYQRSPAAARKLLPEPSWFAYSLRGIKPQTSYVVEVDYPDDARRSMVFSLREDRPLTYGVSAGVDSGGEFSISNAMYTHTLRFWARSDTVRLVVLNVHDGNRAAAAAIRVYREERTPSAAEPSSGRQYINWYEEGANFVSMVGMREEWWKPQTVTEAVQRWVRSAAASGFTMLAPTVAVYEFALYPSRFNRVFSRPDSDYLRRLLLAAEAHGVHVVPELHPRADELDWPFAASPDPKPNALISKAGQSNHFKPDGKSRNHPPHYHPLHPANQDWYVEMIGEMADRYADSPAFAGVSLRLMDWANPSLNNFHSLDWGYDEATVRRFGAETGVPVPSFSEGSSGAGKRHAWLMANARESWIRWRCVKVAEIYTRVRDRVRKARPDLRIYSTIFPFGDGERDRDQLREAGIDPELLSRIEGVLLVNAMTSYGRREPDPIATQRMRDRLIQPGRTSLVPGSRSLSPSWYIEGTEVVAPPEALGFRPGTKSTWMSVPVTPAGRHVLERFAVLLADTDAQMLGDGGNAYAWGQPLQEEWIREFRTIPAERFASRADALDPVAVRTHAGAESLQFYLVNRERYPVRMSLTISGTDAIARPAKRERISLVRQQLELELMPYELRYFTAPPGSRIVSIKTFPPDAERQRVARQVAWLAQATASSAMSRPLSAEQRDAVKRALAQAQGAMAEGHLWRARVVLEDSNLLRAYGQLGAAPPELRDAVVGK